MSIKRYKTRYKNLVKFRYPFLLEKSGKILKFSRRKWEAVKKYYSPKRFQYIPQDSAVCNVGKHFEDEKFTWLKKTYKFLLRDKQRLQLYYGGRRYRYYQLKQLARKALKISNLKKISAGGVLLGLFEDRLQNVIYRLGLVSTLLQSKRLINNKHIKVNSNIITCSHINLQKFDFVQIDPEISHMILGRYLRSNFPFLYLRSKKIFRENLIIKKYAFSDSYVANHFYSSLSQSKYSLIKLKDACLQTFQKKTNKL